MKQLLLASCVALVCLDGQTIKTNYKAEQAFQIEVQSTFTMETTDFSMERDGEPVEARWGAGGGSTVTRSIIITDTVLQAEDGSPTRLTREFESISNDSARSRVDEEFESSLECPFSEVTLELTLDDGEVTA